MNYIIENYLEEGMTVFDPFAGCGTVGLSARIFGHDYELWDLNPILSLLHRVAISPPQEVDVKNTVSALSEYNEQYHPEWSNIDYWFAESLRKIVSKAWGFYHSLDEPALRNFLAVPLLKVSRHFSYDDMGRMKLSKSPKSKERIEDILGQDCKSLFYSMLIKELETLREKQAEYQSLNPVNVEATVHAGVDSLKQGLTKKIDVLITSPPYLISQEYMRQAKMDLFWLGHSEDDVRALGKKEIPYRNISEVEIYSDTYRKFRSEIEEDHIQEIYDNYFRAITSGLERLAANITSYMFLFVGRSSLRSTAIPIDKVLQEHFTSIGWEHEVTVVDTIVARRMFSYGKNPATKKRDMRTKTEHLVVLKKQ